MSPTETEPKTRLLFDRQRTRFFAFPADVALPPGTDSLQQLGGGTVQTDLAVLAAWEIDKEEATRRVGDQVDAQWERLRGAFDQLLDIGRQAAADRGVDVPEQARNVRVPPLDELMGMKPGLLITEPELVREKIRTVLGQAGHDGRTVGEQLRQAASRRAVGQAPPLDPEDLAGKLRAALDNEALQGHVSALGQALGRLGAELQAAGQRMQEPTAEVRPKPTGEPEPGGEE